MVILHSSVVCFEFNFKEVIEVLRCEHICGILIATLKLLYLLLVKEDVKYMKFVSRSLVTLCAVFACAGVAEAGNDFHDVSAAFAAQFTTVNSQLNTATLALDSARYLDFNVNAALSAEETAFTDYEAAVAGLAAGTADASIKDAVSQYKAAYIAYEASMDAEDALVSDSSSTFSNAVFATTEVGRTRDVFADALKTIINARDAANLLRQADVDGVTQSQVDDAGELVEFGALSATDYDLLETTESYEVANGVADVVDVPITDEVMSNLVIGDEASETYDVGELYAGSPEMAILKDEATAIKDAYTANTRIAFYDANGGEPITDAHITAATAMFEAGAKVDVTLADIAVAEKLILADVISQTQIDTAAETAKRDVITVAQYNAAVDENNTGVNDHNYFMTTVADVSVIAVPAGTSPYTGTAGTSVNATEANAISAQNLIDSNDLLANIGDVEEVTREQAQKIIVAYNNQQIVNAGAISQEEINKAIITAARTVVTGDDLIEARALRAAGVINVLTQAEFDAAETLVTDMVGVDTTRAAFFKAEADLIEAIENSDDKAIKAASKALVSATTAVKNAIVVNTKVNDAITAVKAGTMSIRHFNEKIKPDAGVAISGAMSGVTVVNNTIVSHQNTIVASSGKYGLERHSGVNAGSAPLSMGVWLKAFGSDSEMDMRDGVAGYDADTHGVVIGVDQIIGNDLLVGIALSFAGTDVEGKSTARSITDTDQIQGTLYGTLFMNDFFINGSMAYAHSSSNTERTGFGGAVTGEYDATTYSASIGAGMPIDMDSYGIIPQITLAYSHVNPDEYTERGFGALNVNPDSMDLFGIKAGVTLNKKLVFDGGTLSPKLRLIADWDVLQEKALVNSSWASTGTTITPTSGAEPAALGGIIGAGIDYTTDDGAYVFSLDYDLSTRSDFVSHAASAQFRLNF